MANTFAPSEPAFDKVDPKGQAIKDTGAGAALAAQDAYKIGGCAKAAYVEKPTAACPNTLDVPPLWSHPAVDSNSMSSSSIVGKDSGWAPYEALNLQVKEATVVHPQPNGNAIGKGADKSGWGPYEALDLDLKPIAKPHAVGDKKKK